MKLLGLDTATAATSVAFLDTGTGRELARRDDPAGGERPRHTTRLLPLIAELLEAAAEGWGSLDCIAVGLGPGTFTGLRIGIATARALGQARKLELRGISTLRALATGAVPARTSRPADVVLAALDARRGELFAAAWGLPDARSEALGEQALAPVAVDPRTLASRLPGLGASSLAIGPGAVEFRSYLEHAGAFVPGDDSVLHSVNAINHCRLAAAGEGVRALEEIKPQYLRLPDAELARRGRARQ